MLPQYDMDPERRVLNTPYAGENENLIIRADEDKRREARSSRYESVEFTEQSVDYSGAFEDEALLSGQVKPEVSAVYDTGYDGTPNIYDPDSDNGGGALSGDSFDKTDEMGVLSGESFATPTFFKNPVDLTIGCIIAGLVIVLEIIAAIVVF